MQRLSGRPYWPLGFTEDGAFVDGNVDDLLREITAEGVTDLVVLSHGWNTGPDAADRLYEALGPLIVDQAAVAPQLGPLGFVGVHWPALWWPDDRGGGRGSTRSGDALSSGDGSPDGPVEAGPPPASGAEMTAALEQGFPEDRRATVARLGTLIDEGEAAAASGTEPDAAQLTRLAEFHRLVTELLPPGNAPAEDAGEQEFLDRGDPEAFVALARAFGSVPEAGAAQGAGDLFRTVWQGAKDGLRVFSYYTMKARAGVVGREGLAPVLVQLRADRGAALRVHLVGHSFGGRLVSFALAGLPSADDSPVASLVLVQAAFSHYAFSTAKDNPFGKEGALRPYVDRVHGPLVATWSEYDWAVSRWYPKASALARQDNQANPAVDRWGALGAGGFQAVRPLQPIDIRPAGVVYDLAAGQFYAVDASGVIADWQQSSFAGAHSDIRRPEVAWLVANAAAAGAEASAS